MFFAAFTSAFSAKPQATHLNRAWLARFNSGSTCACEACWHPSHSTSCGYRRAPSAFIWPDSSWISSLPSTGGQIAIHAGLLSSRPLVYNPIKQAQDQDPQGEFVKRWVPELARVPVEHIAEPWLMPRDLQHKLGCVIGEQGQGGYPAPIVDFKSASKLVKDRVYALRECKQQTEAASKQGADRSGGQPQEEKKQLYLF